MLQSIHRVVRLSSRVVQGASAAESPAYRTRINHCIDINLTQNLHVCSRAYALCRGFSGAVRHRTATNVQRSARKSAHARAGTEVRQVCPRTPPTGGETGKHLRIRDGPQTRHRQGLRAVVAIERADRATIRERVPRRLPARRGNRRSVVKQTCDAALHTLRTAMPR